MITSYDAVAPRYRITDAAHRMMLADRTVATQRLLRDVGAASLSDRRVLDVGCGGGDSLATLAAAAGPLRAVGVDLSTERLRMARERIRPGTFVGGDALRLPFRDAAFDVVVQSTVLSSLLEEDARDGAAREMLRVLRPGGHVLSYDFTWNPSNRDTRGLRERELRILFDGCGVRSVRVSPPAPVVRRLARRGAELAATRLPLPRTHLLAWITKP